MFESTEVSRCETCARTTPHTRWRMRPLRALAALFLLGALASGLSRLWVAAALLALAGAWVAARERDLCSRIACDRCRERALARLRRDRPGRRTTTIDPL